MQMVFNFAGGFLRFIFYNMWQTYKESPEQILEKDSLMRMTGLLLKGEKNPDSFIEKREYHRKKLIGIAGVMKRYKFLPSFFLVIHPKWQGKGIGTKLAQECIKKWDSPAFLTVAKDNVAAKTVYKKLGFHKVCNWRKIRGKPYEVWIKF